jgi:hypothetical protein
VAVVFVVGDPVVDVVDMSLVRHRLMAAVGAVSVGVILQQATGGHGDSFSD